jgi:hypothetical protein
MSDSNPYTFRRITPELLVDLNRIFFETKGSGYDINYLRKKFDTSFSGISYVGYLAYSETGEPAAFYGVFPCLMEQNGKKFLVAQSGDTITHINHQKKGLFIELARRTYELCAELSIKLVFGFPNENSYPGFIRKLNWIDFGNFESLHIKLNNLPVKRILNKLKIPYHSIYLKPMLSLFSRPLTGSDFTFDAYGSNTLHVQHDPAFLNYKKYNSIHFISFRNWRIMFSINGSSLIIGYIEKENPNRTDDVAFVLKKLGNLLGIDEIRFDFYNIPRFAEYFKHEELKKGIAVCAVLFDQGLKETLPAFSFTSFDSDTF